MTQLLFRDALLNCCTSKMKYCLENNIPFKILLIVDNAPRHLPFICYLHPSFKSVSPFKHFKELVRSAKTSAKHFIVNFLEGISFSSVMSFSFVSFSARSYCSSSNNPSLVSSSGTTIKSYILSSSSTPRLKLSSQPQPC